MVGLLLHWRPRSFVQAIAAAVTPVGGVLIQYPLYAGIVKMMTESGLATQMAHFFVTISTQHTFPVMIGIYSAFLGLFIPSAGGKWLIEAPYMLEAAKSLDVHLGWVVQTYNATEALANLIHPFWMLPLVGILGPEGARHRRLLDAAVRRARAAGAVPGLDPQLHAHLRAAGPVGAAFRRPRPVRAPAAGSGRLQARRRLKPAPTTVSNTRSRGTSRCCPRRSRR